MTLLSPTPMTKLAPCPFSLPEPRLMEFPARHLCVWGNQAMKTTLRSFQGVGVGVGAWHMQYHWLLFFGEEGQESALPFFYFLETHLPLGMPHPIGRASLVVQMVKNLALMQETWV